MRSPAQGDEILSLPPLTGWSPVPEVPAGGTASATVSVIAGWCKDRAVLSRSARWTVIGYRSEVRQRWLTLDTDLRSSDSHCLKLGPALRSADTDSV